MVLRNLIISIVYLIGLCDACTEFIVRAKDDSIAVGRTMDFDIIVNDGFYVEPLGTEYQGFLNGVPGPCSSEGMKWKSLHKMILIRPVEEVIHYVSVDGVNDVGLTTATLYLPGYAVYDNITEDKCGNAISQLQVSSYILGNYENVDQVKEAMNSNTFPYVFGSTLFGIVQPVHYAVTDKSGGAIVIEYTAAGRKVYDNTIRVMTNSPTYDWHMTNIKHYVHLDNKRKPVRKYHDAQFNEHELPIFPASGLLGLPGDYSSPSRFVRAAAMVHFSKVPETTEEAVVSSFHILNSVDVTIGVVQGRVVPSRTFWQFVKDLKNSCIYYRTYQYLSIRKICISDVPNEHSFHLLDNDLETLNDSVEDMSTKLKIIKDEL